MLKVSKERWEGTLLTYRNSVLRVLIPLVSLFSIGCFEYEESLYLAPNYSGFVEYRYKVPLQQESGTSLISFLPATRENVRARFGLTDSGPDLVLQDFQTEEVYEPDTRFPRKRTVKFRIRFSKPEFLETILMGQTRVYYLDQRLVIQRSFPTSGGLREESGRIAQSFHKYLEGTLQDKTLKLSVSAPWYYNLYANAGATAGPGVIHYNLPLEATVNRKSPSLWRIEVKANPMPEGADENDPGLSIPGFQADSEANP